MFEKMQGMKGENTQSYPDEDYIYFIRMIFHEACFL